MIDPDIQNAEWDCFSFQGLEAACQSHYPEDDIIRVMIAERLTDEFEPGGISSTDVMVWFIRNNMRIGAMDFQAVHLPEPVTGFEAIVKASTASRMVYDGMEEIVAGRDDEICDAGTYLIVNNFEIERSVRGHHFGVRAIDAFCEEVTIPDTELHDLLFNTKTILIRPYSDLSVLDNDFAELLLIKLQDALGDPEGILISTASE